MGGKWTQPNRTTDSSAEYKINVENCIAVLECFGKWFNVECTLPETMAVFVQSGYLFLSGSKQVLTIEDWTSTTISKPSSNPRIDLVVMNDDGDKYIVTGSEAASPSWPSVPAGYFPLGAIYLHPDMSVIYQENIMDCRAIQGLGYEEADSGIETYDTVGTYNFTAKKDGPHIVRLVGGGGGGSSGQMQGDGGGGGGSGQFVIGVVELNKGDIVTVRVGKGGAGGPGSSGWTGSPGQSGGQSWFGNYLYAYGGGGGTGTYNAAGGGGIGGYYAVQNLDTVGQLDGENGENGGTWSSGMGAPGGKGGTLWGWGNGGNGGSGYGSAGSPGSGRGGGGGGGAGYYYPSGWSLFAGAGGNGAQGTVRISW